MDICKYLMIPQNTWITCFADIRMDMKHILISYLSNGTGTHIIQSSPMDIHLYRGRMCA
jgi:hypothetical protein